MAVADPYAFEQAIKAHLKRAGLSQATAARQLNYTPEQFNKWIKGVNRMPDVAILELAELLELTNEERTELFTLAGYVAVNTLNKSTSPGDRTPAPVHQNPTTGSTHFRASLVDLGKFCITALGDWNENFFRWSDAPGHARSSWSGLVLYGLTAITNRFSPRGFLIASVSLLLAILTARWLMPVLLWPLGDSEARVDVLSRYALATLLIPFLVSLVTPPDQPDLFQLNTLKQRLTFWVLKFTGALVGFWLFSVLSLGLVLALYYLRLPSLAAPFRAGLALVPLFFSYVVARRIPIERYHMFDGELRTHPVDRLFFAVFIFMGPVTALLLYFLYGFFTARSIAPVVILIAVTLVALWEYRQQKRQSVSDSV